MHQPPVYLPRDGKPACKMAAYTLSIHAKLGVKVIFDRVCSVATTSKLRDVCFSNLDHVDGELQLQHTKVASEKTGPWSDIDSDEAVSTLADLGLRYVMYVLENTADEPEEVAVPQERNVVHVLMQTARERVLPNKLHVNNKKDLLYNDVIDLLDANQLDFQATTAESTGAYVVRVSAFLYLLFFK